MCRTFIYIIFQFSVFITAAAAPAPLQPCASTFEYEKTDTENVRFPSDYHLGWRGVITVPLTIPITLKVKLIVPTFLLSKYEGKLELAENRNQVLRSFYANASQEVKYFLLFPTDLPLPHLVSIEVNSRIVCSIMPVQVHIKTTVVLEHTLLLTNSPGASFSEAGRTFQYRNQDSKDTNCGKPLRGNSVSGSYGNGRKWPWAVPLFRITENGLEFLCSATLVTLQSLITAAHCIRCRTINLSANDIIAHPGRYDIKNWTVENYQPRNVKSIHIHPDYDSETLYSDLAVLTLSIPVTMTPYVIPACLWTGQEDLDLVVGKNAVVFGWGMDGLGNRITATPKLAVMPIVSQEACLRSRNEYIFLTSDRTLCAGFRNGTGPCNGDSGGGLLIPENDPNGGVRWFLRGIVSLSLQGDTKFMCDVHEFTVFTDVAKFQDWIRSLI